MNGWTLVEDGLIIFRPKSNTFVPLYIVINKDIFHITNPEKLH